MRHFSRWAVRFFDLSGCRGCDIVVANAEGQYAREYAYAPSMALVFAVLVAVAIDALAFSGYRAFRSLCPLRTMMVLRMRMWTSAWSPPEYC